MVSSWFKYFHLLYIYIKDFYQDSQIFPFALSQCFLLFSMAFLVSFRASFLIFAQFFYFNGKTMFLRVFRSVDFCMFQIGRSDVIKHKMLFFWNLRTTASKAPVLRRLSIYWGSCSIKQVGLQFYRKKDSTAGIFLWVLRNFSELDF